jgi:hypothetical protein
MALPILDGNQSATTLSSILTSGEHIPAHTVVSLGTQAITDISGAVSGSVVSISNFPATQPVSIASVTIGNSVTISSLPPLAAGTAQIGSVTASVTNPVTVGAIVGPIGGSVFKGGSGSTDAIRALPYFSQNGSANYNELSTNNPLPIAGTITIGSLPAISGTVTANVAGNLNGAIEIVEDSGNTSHKVAVQIYGINGNPLDNNTALLISGTVTVGNSVTIASLPALVAGTAQIGSVTASISSFVTSVTARLINPAGTAVTYAEVGTAGSPSIDVLSVQGVTSGTPLTILNHQGTAVTTSDFTSTTDSTVLANYNASREVLTIFNEGAGNLHICAGATCTTIAYQVRLSAGDYYEVPNHQTTITHSAVFATAGTARVTEVS